jgi:hypothetical protein
MSSFGEGVRKEAEDKHRKEREKELAQVTHSFVLSISQNSQFYCVSVIYASNSHYSRI